MKSPFTHFLLVCLALSLPVVCQGEDIIGMDRSQIVENFGKPQNALKRSSKEILNYPQGQIILIQGKVSSFNGPFSIEEEVIETPPETGAPVVEKPVVEKPVVETQSEPVESRRSIQPFRWSYTLAEAQARSEKEGRPILALFTGPDWCAPCQQLEAEVLNTSEFNRLGRKQFIPLKIALYMNTHQDPKAKEEYHRLSEEYGVDAVPSFVILESDGGVIAKPDILKTRKDVSSFSEQVILAINEAEDSSGGMSLYVKIGVAVAGGVLLVLLRK